MEIKFGNKGRWSKTFENPCCRGSRLKICGMDLWLLNYRPQETVRKREIYTVEIYRGQLSLAPSL